MNFRGTLTYLVLVTVPVLGLGHNSVGNGGGSARPSCEEFLTGIRRLTGAPFANEPVDQDLNVPTLEFVGRRPGRHGGERILVRRTHPEQVYSMAQDPRIPAQITAPQGDPRWMITLLGAPTARFLGYEVLNDSTVLMPDVTEINAALDKINARIAATDRRFLLRFYSPGENAVLVPEERYLDEFSRGRLPIAPSGLAQLHDLSYHAPALLFPPIVLHRVSRIAGEFNRLASYIDSVGRRQSQYAWIRDHGVASMIRVEPSYIIDGGTGNLAPVLSDYERGLVGDLNHEVFQIYARFLHRGAALSEIFSDYAKGVRGRVKIESGNPFPMNYRNEIASLIERYVARRRAQDPEFDLDFQMGTHGIPRDGENFSAWNRAEAEALCRLFQEQRLLLIQVIQGMSNE